MTESAFAYWFPVEPKKAKRKKPVQREEQEQIALIDWARLYRYRGLPLTTWLYAIPNGGKRDARTAARLKAAGVRAGVSDVHLPIRTSRYTSLWFELKATPPHNAPATKDQREWVELMRAEGARAEIVLGWEAAKALIVEYLGE